MLALVLVRGTTHSQLSGTKTIPGDYATLTAAVADLNSAGVGAGGVTFNVVAGYTETIAARINLTASGTASDPIIFQKSGVGSNPIITAYVGSATPTSTAPDGIWSIVGGDYITIDGIDLSDPNASNPATMEYGYGLFKAGATNGCQNVTIKNCTITLNRINNASGTAPMVEGSVGILVVNALPTSATTALTPSSTAGSNSNNKFYSNTIQNCNYGIALSGYAAPSPFMLGDTGNDIGGSAALTGNSILNFGGGTGATNPSAAVRANHQWGVNISYNTINNNNGGGVNHPTTLRGIYGQAGTSASATISNNSVTLSSGATTSDLRAIDNAIGVTAASNAITINNNTIQNCSYTTATSGSFYGIVNSANAASVTISGNTITDASQSGTGSFYGIQTGSPSTLVVSNNLVSNITRTGSGGFFYGIHCSSGDITVSNNQIHHVSFGAHSGGSSAKLYGIYNNSSPSTQVFASNSIHDLTISGSSMSSDNILYGLYASASSSSAITMNANTIYSLAFNNSSTGIAPVRGIYFRTGSSGTGSVSANKVFDLTAQGSSSLADGMYFESGGTVSVNNNIIGKIYTPSASGTAPVRGINIAGGTTFDISFNSVYLDASSTGSSFGSSTFSCTVAPTVTLRNNIFVNMSTPSGSGKAITYLRTSTTLTTYGASSNNNLFYAGTPSASRVVFFDFTNADQTLAAFQTRVAPRDAASFTENPPFLSTTGSDATFLHINTTVATQIESGAQPIAGIATDFDGDTRNGTTPDVGADEFNGTSFDLSPPTISYIALGNTTSTSNRILATTITDASGVASGAGAPRLYFKRGASGTWQSVTATTVSPPTYSFTFDYSLVGGISAGDTIYYYVAAQDIVTPTPNSGTNPAGGGGINPPGSTPPTLLNSYRILHLIATFPYFESFEDTAASPMIAGAGWSTGIVSGSVNDWVRATPAKSQLASAHSGSKCYVTNATGFYAPNQNSYLESPVFNFSALVSDPILVFWQNFLLETSLTSWDGGVLEYSTDGGESWRRVDSTLGTGATFNTANSTGWYNDQRAGGTMPIQYFKWSGSSTGYAGHSNGWIESTTRLVGLAGQPDVRLRWRIGTSAFVNDEGWAIDDVSITTSALPPSCTDVVSPAHGAVNVSVTTALRWTTGGGSPSGYKLFFGTDNPPTNLINGTNLGNVLTYDPPGHLNFLTTYYWKVVPTNMNGDASGCTIWSFTTGADTRSNISTPDGGGYLYSASHSTISPRPNYEWHPSGPNGSSVADSLLTGTSQDDALSAIVRLPSPFQFYGQMLDSVRASTNGFLVFVDGVTGQTITDPFSNDAHIPTPALPNFVIAPVWSDLDTVSSYGNAGVYVRWDPLTQVFTFEWYHFGLYDDAGTVGDMVFQVNLYYSDFSIGVSYASVGDGGFTLPQTDIGSVGIEGSGAATFGSSYFFRGDLPLNVPTAATTVKFGASLGSLPVQIASFVAHMNPSGGVRLDWRTLTEINNYGFFVERKTYEQQSWSTISDLIPGHGTTNEPHDYRFDDRTAFLPAVYFYRLRQLDLDGTVHYTEPISIRVGTTEVVESAPYEFTLSQNYPNPFNPQTEIKFSVERTGLTTLVVYNMLGQSVANLFADVAEAGRYYRVRFDGATIASGVYLYKLEAGPFSQVKRMLLLK
jgi:hypothetical protein